MLIFACMRKYSKKGLERRKKDREGYKEFFEKHIDIIKQGRLSCEECGVKLRGSVREIAHVLPKSYFKSISTDDENIIYLCEKHHNEYDNSSNEDMHRMSIMTKVQNRFESLQDKIKEDINWKHYDRWEN